MGNILVLTSKYSGTASANGICARNIVTELRKKGHNVSVLCYENNGSENNVYTIKKDNLETRMNIFSKAKILIKSFFMPITNHEVEDKYKEYTISLCEKKKIDTVICFFFPIETVTVLNKIKEAFPDILTIIYELDSIGDGIFASSKLRYIATLAYERWETVNYYNADKIIIMKSHEKYWRRVWEKMFEEKLLISDIPVLLKSELASFEKKDNPMITFLYGGVLNKKYRSPKYLLELIHILSNEVQVKMDFYSKGDCEQMIFDYAKKDTFIHQLGYVPQEEIKKAIINADVLVNIGNRISSSVPSKLITYLSYGKPIVHFSSRKDDVCIDYLEKYPLGLVLYECDSIEKNTELLFDFLKKNRNKKVCYWDIESRFKMNTPQYSAEIIDDLVNSY